MISDYFKLSLGNIKHKGLRSWLTILGVVVGIAAVVALISLGNALQAAVTGQLGALSVDTLTIQNKGTGFGPPGSTVVEKLDNNDLEIIEGAEGEEGRLLEEGDNGKVLLGNNFLETEDFEGDFAVGKNIKLNGKEFEIAGILEKSSTFQLNIVVFMMNDDLENLLE